MSEKKKKGLFRNLFPSAKSVTPSNTTLEDYPLSQWTTQMVVSWLKDQGHDKKIYRIFEKNKITGTFFCKIPITKGDIVGLGIKPGLAITLHQQIETLQERMKSINPYNVILSEEEHKKLFSYSSSPSILYESNNNNNNPNSIASLRKLSVSSSLYESEQYKDLEAINGSIISETTTTSDSSPSSSTITTTSATSTTTGSVVNNNLTGSLPHCISMSDLVVEDDYFLEVELESFTVNSKEDEEKEKHELLGQLQTFNSRQSISEMLNDDLINEVNNDNNNTLKVMNNNNSNHRISGVFQQPYVLVPVAPLEEVPNEYKNNYEYCLQNLKNNLPFELTNIRSIAQDLIIPERFLFKYCNTKLYMQDDEDDNSTPTTSANSNSNNSNSNNNKSGGSMSRTFLKIQFVINSCDRGVWFRLQKQNKNQLKGMKPHKFGVFYPAILIGPFLFEYTPYGIALVRSSKAKRVIGHEITTVTNVEKVKDVLMKMAQVCCEFNGSKKYDIQKNNGIHFVYACLDKLRMRKLFDNHFIKGCMKLFIQNLEKFGFYSMTLSLPKQLSEHFHKEEYIIDSHKDLDEFHISVQTNFPDYFDGEGKSDETLLQSFDIAFWYYHFENRKVEEFKPAFHSKLCKCPFNMLEKHPIDMIDSLRNSNFRGPSYNISDYLPERPTTTTTQQNSRVSSPNSSSCEVTTPTTNE
ncbi:hypothetical protein ABK040_008871 [Willaertia magna]